MRVSRNKAATDNHSQVFRVFRSVLLFSTLLTAVPALAEDAEADGLITVTANRDAGYQVRSTGTATRTDTPLLDVPQTVDVLTRDRLDDQALLSVQEAFRYIPGAVGAQGEGNRDQIVLRGNNSTADFFVDGMRDDVQYFRDFYNIERLEILKGSNAMIFGRGGGGGVVNRVTKTPQAAAFFGGDAGIDSWGAWRLTADINQPLGKGISARLNGVYEDGASHRDGWDLERWGFNPTLGLDLGGRGNLVLGYEHFEDRRTADRGVPSLNGRPLTGYRDTIFGDTNVNVAAVNVDAATLAGDYALSDSLTIRNRSRFADYDKIYSNIYPSTSVQADGSFGLDAYRDTTRRENLFSQTDLVWETKTGDIGHVLLAGFELGRQTSDVQRINGFFNASGPAVTRVFVTPSDPFTAPPVFFRPGVGSGARTIHTRANVVAGFVQDQISIGDHIQVLAGLRYDRFSLDFTNVVSGASFDRVDHLWSPRLGLILKPMTAASLYASYSRSYLPQSGDQFSSLDASLAALEPERFENWEVGGKWDITPALNATVALYRLDRTNTRAPGANAGEIVLTGAQRSQGLEVSLNGQLARNWQVQAGIAVQDAEIRTTTASAPAGRKVPLVPDFQASLWTRYDVNRTFGLGLGVTHQDESFAGISNTVMLPAYTRFDGALFVRLTDRLQAQVNVENLFNTGYFPTAHTDNNISTGGPRAARLTLRSRF